MPPLTKQPVAVNFSKGLDTKTDPWQIPLGNFSELTNSVFTKQGLLQKRDGYGMLPTPPLEVASYLTTLNGNLLAIGNQIQPYSEPTTSWVSDGLTPRYNISLSTVSLKRDVFDWQRSDSSTSANGLTCLVQASYNIIFTSGSSSAVQLTQYIVSDSVTGQAVIGSTSIQANDDSMRVFNLGTYFIIVYQDKNDHELKYIAINTATLVVNAPVVLAATPDTSERGIDGIVLNNVLYVAYNNTGAGLAFITLTSGLVVGTSHSVDTRTAFNISVTDDLTNNNLWFTYIDVATNLVFTRAFTTPALTPLFAPASVFPLLPLTPIGSDTGIVTSLATGGVLTVYAGVPNAYSYDNTIYTNYIEQNTVTNAGAVGTPTELAAALQPVSKAFYINGQPYLMGIYSSKENQSALFLINGLGLVVARVAQGNAGVPSYDQPTGLYPLQLPGVTVLGGTTAYLSYLVADFVESENDGSGNISEVLNNGVNQLTLNFANTIDASVELGSVLSISGGFLWNYDGLYTSENGFFLNPESVEVEIISPGSGNLTAQEYMYQVIYTFVDNKGNLVQSGASLPVSITLPSSSNVRVHFPNYRIGYKLGCNVQIYRWSVAQPTFFSITNDLILGAGGFSDSNVFDDTLSDPDILGNEILYTTGGVLENSSAPSTTIMTIWDDRLWMVDAEDPNLLWYSKTVLEGTPVDMSADLTYYVATAVGSQGAVGPITGLHQLDDKLIIFHENLIEYINGQGPDNTGSNSAYSQLIFITSTTGCISSNSIAVIPSGLIFQSDKGIWLLGRDLSTTYIGAAVERYTQFDVTQPLVIAATVIPDTTQVRLVMSTGVILMYDYFYNQWGTFTNITATSSTLYQGLHTLLDSAGRVIQETPNLYVDYTATAVNMAFQTSWINMAGLQGFERFYYFYLLGQYFSSHTLNIQIGYDYLTTIEQTLLLTPAQVLPLPVSTSNVEQWRIFPVRQKCQAFQITITEQDATPLGQGLSISGLNLVIGTKKGYPVRRENLSIG